MGPTSSGKTSFSIRLAILLKKNNIVAEIVSADSRQIYKELNLLSGKVTKREMAGIPHHMLSVASARRSYSVSRFKKDAEKKINEIIKRGHLPILVGGSGFYVDAVTKGIVLPEVAPDHLLRKKLSHFPTNELFAQLQTIDKQRSASIDKKNPIRLIRAIEIATALGAVPKTTKKQIYDVVQIYIDLPDTELRKRIHTRLLSRIKSGMIQEAKKLHDSGISWKRMNDLGLECRYCALYLQGTITKKEMFTMLESAIWKYAKRQRTWFKKNET